MHDDFERRLSAARDRSLAKQAAPEGKHPLITAIQDAIQEWETRILPLINDVVEAANPLLKGSGWRVELGEGVCSVLLKHACAEVALPYVAVLGRPEHDSTMGSFYDPHITIGVGDDGTIWIGPAGETDSHFLEKLDRSESFESFDRRHVETAIADLVDAITR